MTGRSGEKKEMGQFPWDALKKSSFPRRRKPWGLILLGLAVGKHGFSE
jgi:hypothetical protein